MIPAPQAPTLAEGDEQAVLTQRTFRDVLGRFSTGIVLITAQTPDGVAGVTANSFASVSLDPPLIVVCAAFTSTTWPSIRAVGGFAVTILSEDHEETSRTFSARGADRFTGREWAVTPAGHPVLPDGLGWLDCEIETVLPQGDHELIVARATWWSGTRTGQPLIFHSGRYARLAAGEPR